MSNLEGIIPAIPTPLLENEDVDINGLRKVLDYVIEQGSSGLFILGSMGEGPALLDSQKKIAVKTAVEHIKGTVPLLAGIADVSTRRMIEQAKAIRDLQPDYLVITTPYYYRFPHPDSLLESVCKITDALEQFAKTYYAPLIENLRQIGIQALEKHWQDIFTSQSGKFALHYEDNTLVLNVDECPAIAHLKKTDQLFTPRFCQTTVVVNKTICHLAVCDCSCQYEPGRGRCVQKFWKNKNEEPK